MPQRLSPPRLYAHCYSVHTGVRAVPDVDAVDLDVQVVDDCVDRAPNEALLRLLRLLRARRAGVGTRAWNDGEEEMVMLIH